MADYTYLPSNCRTGCELVDDDHENLYHLVTMFSEAKGDIAIVKSVFVSIVEYTVYHFDREERGFAAGGYSDATHHIEEHEALKTTALHVLHELEATPEVFTDAKMASVEIFLRHWLEYHITKSDMAFAPYFDAHPEAVAAMASVSFADSFGEDDEFSGSDGLLDCV